MSRILLALVVVVLVVVVTAGVVVNAAASNAFSPEQAVRAYLAAQAKADVTAMLANADFTRGDGSFSEYFGRDAVARMMRVPANRDLRDVHVAAGVRNGATAIVTATFTQNGTARRLTYTVVQDAADTHLLLYHSWRVQVPYSHLHLTLPNQPGLLSVDGILLPLGASAADLQVIGGYHQVVMAGTPLLKEERPVVEATGEGGSASVPAELSDVAATEARSKLHDDFFGGCDPAKYSDCPDHTYRGADPANYIYYFDLPGYGEVDYTTYTVAVDGDPLSGMQLALGSAANTVTAGGVCQFTFNVDGTRHYTTKGHWHATLTWSAGSFVSDFVESCEEAKA